MVNWVSASAAAQHIETPISIIDNHLNNPSGFYYCFYTRRSNNMRILVHSSINLNFFIHHEEHEDARK